MRVYINIQIIKYKLQIIRLSRSIKSKLNFEELIN